jgi:succinate dehydrogenase / fumarate reductase cytochrome b subunit
LTIRFPLTAIASILHRLSGFFLFLVIPLFLSIMTLSLSSAEGFSTLHAYLTDFLTKCVLLIFLAALFYHLLAGIRHLVMDAGIGEGLIQARFSAGVIILLAVLLTGWMGIYLW